MPAAAARFPPREMVLRGTGRCDRVDRRLDGKVSLQKLVVSAMYRSAYEGCAPAGPTWPWSIGRPRGRGANILEFGPDTLQTRDSRVRWARRRYRARAPQVAYLAWFQVYDEDPTRTTR